MYKLLIPLSLIVLVGCSDEKTETPENPKVEVVKEYDCKTVSEKSSLEHQKFCNSQKARESRFKASEDKVVEF